MRKNILIPMIVLTVVCSSVVLILSIALFRMGLNDAANSRINVASSAAEHEIDVYKTSSHMAAVIISEEAELIEAMSGGDRGEILAALAPLLDITDIEFCTILDADGIIIARTHYPGEYGDDLSYQENVASALEGVTSTVIERGTAIHLSVRTGAPIYDENNNIIGVVSAGYRLDTVEFVEKIKKITNNETSVIYGDERISTTIKNDGGAYATGTKLPAYIMNELLAGRSYVGNADVYGKSGIAKYSPLYGANNEVIGAIAVVDFSRENTNRIISFVAWGVLLTLLVLAAAVAAAMKISGIIDRKIDGATQLFRQAEKERDALSYLENILSGIDAMIYATDPETDEILFINDTMQKHFSIEENSIGKLCYKVLQKNMDTRCAFCPCNNLDIDSDESVIWEEHNTFTGRFYRNSDKYINWHGGKRVHLQHSVDITDIKKTQKSLERREELLRAVNKMAVVILSQDSDSFEDTMSKGLFIISDAIRIHRFSVWRNFEISGDLRFGQIYRWDLDSGGTTPTTEALTNLSYSKHAPDWLKIIEKDESVNTIVSELPASSPTTALLKQFGVISVFIVPIFFDGELWGFGFFEDRKVERLFKETETEIMRSTASLCANTIIMHDKSTEIEAALTKAQEANRAKSAFLANMSHEIRTPMNAILGITEMQLQSDCSETNRKEALEKIYDSGNLLMNIINDILDLSKIEANKLEITPVKYEIPSLIVDTIQLNRLRYEGKPIEFFLDVDEETPFSLYGDELRLKQILNNILSNAFKYTDEGNVKVFVWAEPRDDENIALVVRVSDTGQGMTIEQLSTLFHEYTRYNLEANRTTIGTGLGMSITKRLLDLMGGEIHVKSEVGVGSVFTVRIPQKRVDNIACGRDITEKLKNLRFQNTAISKVSRMIREYMPYGSVLIVDDVESNIYVTVGMLLPYALQTDAASSGFEAIEKIKSGKIYDIIFMDHMMPRMDGIEATGIIRGMGYTGKIVALTANAIVGQAEVFLQKGFDGFISKPIDSRELNAVLNEYIRDKKPPEVVAAARREQRLKNAEKTNKRGEKAAAEKKLTELEKCFLLDAQNAVGVLEEFQAKDYNLDEEDTEMYQITVHGMKSALNNIGEKVISAFAYKLEQAAKSKDVFMIKEETDAFINALKAVFKKISG